MSNQEPGRNTHNQQRRIGRIQGAAIALAGVLGLHIASGGNEAPKPENPAVTSTATDPSAASKAPEALNTPEANPNAKPMVTAPHTEVKVANAATIERATQEQVGKILGIASQLDQIQQSNRGNSFIIPSQGDALTVHNTIGGIRYDFDLPNADAATEEVTSIRISQLSTESGTDVAKTVTFDLSNGAWTAGKQLNSTNGEVFQTSSIEDALAEAQGLVGIAQHGE